MNADCVSYLGLWSSYELVMRQALRGLYDRLTSVSSMTMPSKIMRRSCLQIKSWVAQRRSYLTREMEWMYIGTTYEVMKSSVVIRA